MGEISQKAAYNKIKFIRLINLKHYFANQYMVHLNASNH